RSREHLGVIGLERVRRLPPIRLSDFGFRFGSRLPPIRFGELRLRSRRRLLCCLDRFSPAVGLIDYRVIAAIPLGGFGKWLRRAVGGSVRVGLDAGRHPEAPGLFGFLGTIYGAVLRPQLRRQFAEMAN
ncbi:hypothetical protein, partial [Mycobacterium sp.]|uniref:hypothetical protein n=1 Tax=Mycobacterium sp. TaxID=1785 RepID=UPI003CB9191E